MTVTNEIKTLNCLSVDCNIFQERAHARTQVKHIDFTQHFEEYIERHFTISTNPWCACCKKACFRLPFGSNGIFAISYTGIEYTHLCKHVHRFFSALVRNKTYHANFFFVYSWTKRKNAQFKAEYLHGDQQHRWIKGNGWAAQRPKQAKKNEKRKNGKQKEAFL